MNLRRLAIASLLAASVASGCSRSKKSPEASPAPPPPPAPAAGLPNPAAERAAASREQEQLRLKPPQKAAELPSEALLVWACDRFLERNGRDAKDIDELVSRGLLTVPPAPPGKKYLLNSHDCTLTIVSK